MHPFRPQSVRYALANLAVALSVTFGLVLIMFAGVIGSSQATTAAIGAAILVAIPIFAWNPSMKRAAIAFGSGTAAATATAILLTT